MANVLGARLLVFSPARLLLLWLTMRTARMLCAALFENEKWIKRKEYSIIMNYWAITKQYIYVKYENIWILFLNVRIRMCRFPYLFPLLLLLLLYVRTTSIEQRVRVSMCDLCRRMAYASSTHTHKEEERKNVSEPQDENSHLKHFRSSNDKRMLHCAYAMCASAFRTYWNKYIIYM